MHPLVALAPALFVSLPCCPLPHPLTAGSICQAPLNKTSSQHRVSAFPHFSALQPILPFKPYCGRFPLPLSQSTTVPWAVTRVFACWQHILSSALACLWGSCLFPSLPKGIHGCRHRSLIPTVPDRPVWLPRRDVSLSSAPGEHCSLLL